MAVTHPTAVRNAIADLVVDGIDAGAAAGTLEFQTAGSVEVATLTFSDPAFGAAAAGVATASAITSDSSATGAPSPRPCCRILTAWTKCCAPSPPPAAAGISNCRALWFLQGRPCHAAA